MPVFHATRITTNYFQTWDWCLCSFTTLCFTQTTNPHRAENHHPSTNLKSNQQKKFIKSGILRPEDNNKYERFFFSLNNAPSPIIFKPEADACVPRKQRINPHQQKISISPRISKKVPKKWKGIISGDKESHKFSITDSSLRKTDQQKQKCLTASYNKNKNKNIIHKQPQQQQHN